MLQKEWHVGMELKKFMETRLIPINAQKKTNLIQKYGGERERQKEYSTSG